ncbi:hypothetical protein JTB14_032310 [Gonioctena quinquepunctata]|nr:hypothetical protein JTB14_032310 [Gonioctena quinquepunctata]
MRINFQNTIDGGPVVRLGVEGRPHQHFQRWTLASSQEIWIQEFGVNTGILSLKLREARIQTSTTEFDIPSI